MTYFITPSPVFKGTISQTFYYFNTVYCTRKKFNI